MWKKEYYISESLESEENPVNQKICQEFSSDPNGDVAQFVMGEKELREVKQDPVVPDMGPEYSSDKTGHGPAIVKDEVNKGF